MEDLNDLFKIKNYYYRVWKYKVGLSQLTLRATDTQKKHHNIHITFHRVHYFQFPAGWKGDLYLAPDNELREILKRAEIPVVDINFTKKLYSLFKADAPNSTIYILGKLSLIEHDVEPIYN